MASYINSFHRPHDTTYGPSHFEVSAKPTEYLGFMVYRRLPECFDVVSDGVCVGMYAGLNGAKRAIDAGRHIALAAA